MTTLLTGATGLIGSHIVHRLIDRGVPVRVLVRNESQKAKFAGLPVEVAVGDVAEDQAAMVEACDGCASVIHTAAHFAYSGLPASQIHNVAVNGTENVLRACAAAGVKRVVVTSSSVVFGYSESQRHLRSEQSDIRFADGDPPYMNAKVVQHNRALEISAQLGLQTILACPTMTLGPTTSTLGPSNAIVAAYLADPFRCTYGGGCNIVSASDIAAGHILLAERGVPGRSYILGAENLTWNAIHTMISELAGISGPRFEINYTGSYLAAAGEELRAWFSGRPALSSRDQAAMIGRYYWYSHELASDLGYDPVSARDALVETISWMVASQFVSRETRMGLQLSPDIYRYRRSEALRRSVSSA